MKKVMDLIEKAGLIPVVEIEDANDATPMVKALLDGGLCIMEITIRTEWA